MYDNKISQLPLHGIELFVAGQRAKEQCHGRYRPQRSFSGTSAYNPILGR